MIWLKRILFTLAAMTLWIALTLLFVSKERLCNAAIEAASEAQVNVCYDTRTTSPIGCSIERMTLLYAHSPVAKVGALRITPLELALSSIRLEGMAASLVPPNIRSVTVRLLPGTIRAEGDFGTLEGDISWRTRTVTLRLTPSSVMRRNFVSTLRYFSLKNGKYTYATSF
ncbi:hypothetical protein [Hydrogenimonas cancrithermarum]|uniref:Uncharacterized protein n=1 Tax=Hydrogenimonas cancrithermarum TaxID=2993563 RepID=A0ABN6WWF4_9BACT|nr:hypothetical protein [Hydrogenimonas cancrithermarum]BDY13459.1 hypothetical protein HCR_17710 [Hydrogenimonas cancrithermarum]